MSSVTGNFLKGSIYSDGQFLRADIVSTSPEESGKIRMHHDFCLMNKLGYIPLVSSFTGVFRSFVAIVHIVIHLARSIFEEEAKEKHLLEAKLGAENLARGIVEILPIAGNLILGAIDLTRIYLRWEKFRTEATQRIHEGEKECVDFFKRINLAGALDDKDKASLCSIIGRAKQAPILWKLFNPELLCPEKRLHLLEIIRYPVPPSNLETSQVAT